MEGKIESVKDGKVVESMTFKSKEDAIMHIIGLMETFNIDSEELEY